MNEIGGVLYIHLHVRWVLVGLLMILVFTHLHVFPLAYIHMRIHEDCML